MLNREDKADVKRHMGAKMANKVAKATKDDWTPASQMASEIKKGYRSNLIAQSSPKDKALSKKMSGGITSSRQKAHDDLRTKAIADNWMKRLKNE